MRRDPHRRAFRHARAPAYAGPARGAVRAAGRRGLILHASDLDDPAILDELRQVAPVRAVRGNLHLQTPWLSNQCLPLSLDLEIAGQRVVVTHDHLSFWRNLRDKH